MPMTVEVVLARLRQGATTLNEYEAALLVEYNEQRDQSLKEALEKAALKTKSAPTLRQGDVCLWATGQYPRGVVKVKILDWTPSGKRVRVKVLDSDISYWRIGQLATMSPESLTRILDEVAR